MALESTDKQHKKVLAQNLLNHSLFHESWDFSTSFNSSTVSKSGKIYDSDYEDNENKVRSYKYASCIIAQQEVSCKIIIIGHSGVGKSSFIKRFIENKFAHNEELWTAGVDFALKVVKWSDNVSVKLQLWDIAGQERFTSMTRVYYKDAHACIIMFDLSQRQTFLNALKWKRDLDSKCTLPDGNPIPCILLANKCDLKHREVEQSEIESFCKEQEFIGWTEVSVKEGLMVEEAMRFLLSDMMQRYNESNLLDSTKDDRVIKTVKLNSSSGSDNDSESSKCKC